MTIGACASFLYDAYRPAESSKSYVMGYIADSITLIMLTWSIAIVSILFRIVVLISSHIMSFRSNFHFLLFRSAKEMLHMMQRGNGTYVQLQQTITLMLQLLIAFGTISVAA